MLGNPQAQVEYTKSELNEGGYWQMPARNYSVHKSNVHLYALDTNGVQGKLALALLAAVLSALLAAVLSALLATCCLLLVSTMIISLFIRSFALSLGSVRRRFPGEQQELYRNIEKLESELDVSNAKWKIVFAHHPVYTKSREHGTLANCLREQEYFHKKRGVMAKGYNLAQVLQKSSVDLYISGHEHVMQLHQRNGVTYAVAGASGGQPTSFYGGEDENTEIDFWDVTLRRYGFLSVIITGDKMLVQFLNHDLTIVKEVLLEK
jgi:hypothetical protein